VSTASGPSLLRVTAPATIAEPRTELRASRVAVTAPGLILTVVTLLRASLAEVTAPPRSCAVPTSVAAQPVPPAATTRASSAISVAGWKSFWRSVIAPSSSPRRAGWRRNGPSVVPAPPGARGQLA
jgi:hypothetical protein